MASPNNNLSVLPWYTSLDKQNAKKWYAFGNVWPLVMPTNRIIPYQFVVPFTNVAITGSSIISLDTKDIYDGQSSHTLVTRVDYTVVKSNGFTVSLPEGRYYAKIDFANGVTYYSEVFTLVSNISDYVKIQYWNDDILVYNGGEINYEDEFKFEMYLCTTIGKPEYSFEEEVTKRLGYKFPELQVSNKLYKFTCIGPEYLCDAMRLIRLSDYIKIVSKDDSYNALTFSYDAKWETQGDLASIEVEFETDTIIQKLSSFNRGQREGFYNALLVDINEALLFDENTVALYYDEYRSSTRAVDVEGKLIRELELITEVGENSQIVVDTGQGPAVRMNLYELIKNFIKRDSNEIIEGLWTFKKGLKTGNDKDGEPTGEITENGYLKYIALIVKEFISSEKFVSGLLGEGFKIYEKNGTWYIECDNLTVRQVLTVFEMIISKLRAVNGGLVVSPGNNTIKSVSETDTQYVLEVEDDIEIAKDDFIRHQVFSTSHTKNYWVKVINVAEGKIYTNKSEYNGTVPAKGDEIITMGNATNSKRQGLIYITAAEDGRPRIEILEGVKDKTLAATNRTVLGNLDDIQDSAFEEGYQPSGSGLYCDNAFLRGIFILRSGKNVETEIDAAQKAAQEAASKAANAEKTANDAKDRLNKWADDGFISPAEKLSLIQEGQDLKAEKLEIVNDATKYTIDTTSYIAAYNDYLAQLQYYTQAEPENIKVLPAFEQAQTKYYTQRTAILNAISAKAKALVDAANATADAAKKAADAAKTAADAAKINADKANSLLADIANDNKLTAQEKQQTKKEWDIIVSEKPKNDASADKYGVSKTSYGNAYNALSSYITPLLSSLNTTSDITGTDFRAKFKAYYDARTDLLNAISAKAKALVDAADKKIESVKTELSAVDGKITLAVKTAKEEAISASKTYTNSEIKVVKDQIALKVDSKTFNALNQKVTEQESQITLNKNNIEQRVTKTEYSKLGKLFVSSGNNDVGNTGYFTLNGTRYSHGGRGHTIYKINRSNLAVANVGWYDTYAAGANCTNFVNGLKSVDENHIVVIISYGACSVDGNMADALKKYGGLGQVFAQIRNSHAFVGIKNIGEGAGLDFVYKDRKAEISSTIVDGTPVGMQNLHVPLTRLTSAETKITQNANEIQQRATKSTVDALTGRVTTAESKITQNANSISLKITASEAANIANNAVNNLQIGGTNLLVNTDFLHNKDYWTGSGDVDSSVTLQGRNSLRMITSGLTSDSWRGVEQIDTPYLSAKQGDTFTISLFSRTDNISSFDRGANMEIRYYNSSGGRITQSGFNIKPSTNNTWTRFAGTGTCPAGTVKVSAVWYNIRNGRIWVNGIKLEVGKKATDWTRSPHDSPTTQDVKSSFTIDTGGISMLGKKLSLTGMVTFNSLASDAQKKINTAQNTANTAKSTADAAYNKKIELAQLGTTVISGGFIKTSLIKADEIIVSKLSGATGTFKQLQAVGSNGSVKGTLRLDGDRLWYDGDQYQQGTKDGRSLRYYLSDAWVRGNFGAHTRTTLLVQGSSGYFYPKGADKAGVYKSFERGTASDGRTYYKLPCYGLDGDYAGMPVDLIVFNVTSSNQHFYELQLAVTQKVNMINCNNNYTNVLIYCNGNYPGLPGGSVHYAWNVLPFMNPQPTANVLGRGLLFGGSNDNDWK